MRKIWLILATALLILALMGNLFVWRLYTTTTSSQEIEIQQLDQRVDQQAQSLSALRDERTELKQQLQDARAEKTGLEQELAACLGYEDLLERLDRLEAETRALRRLVPTETVGRVFLSREELRTRLEILFAEEYPPQQAAVDAQLWTLLELFDPGVDLHQLLLDLYTEEVMGFYDLEEAQLYIVGDTGLDPLEQLTFVHEYTHALQDQLFDLGEQTEAVADDSDRARALMALAEGDATLAMQQYLVDHLDELASLELLGQVLLADTRLFDAAPLVVREELLFPYEQGLAFVTTHYTRTGWAAVNEVWRDPPQSTEQILHPERYPEDTPEWVTIPALTSTLGAGWSLYQEDTLGEFILRLHLAVRLEEQEVDEAATGWGGDRYVLYVNPETDEACLAVYLVWDDEDEADEFVEAYIAYADERYGPISDKTKQERDVEDGIWWAGRPGPQANRHPGLYLQQDGDEVKLILAPSEALAKKVARKLR